MARRQQQSKSNRMGRVNEQIKKVVSQAINYELTNKKVTGMVTVTRVNTTPDLRYSRIYISLFNCKNNAETVEGLNESEPFLRSRVASEINMRITPELVFKIDDSAEQGEKIDRIIDKIKKDDEEFRKTHPNMMQDENEESENEDEE